MVEVSHLRSYLVGGLMLNNAFYDRLQNELGNRVNSEPEALVSETLQPALHSAADKNVLKTTCRITNTSTSRRHPAI
jgi:hypothetical protein